MLHEHLRMHWLIAVALVAGCTSRNPRACPDGICIDPNYPFCDLDGTVAGHTKECVAVDCNPGTFKACRDDAALTCNALGNDYDTLQCARGCDVTLGGCRLCDPNQSVCENSQVATCDATGKVVSTESCPLGCFGTEPRCRDIDPSNSLGGFFGMVPDPPDMSLASATINTQTGAITDQSGTSLGTFPSFVVPAPSGGAAIRVFVAHHVNLGNVSVSGTTPGSSTGTALAILATDEIRVSARLRISGAAGGFSDPACAGGNATEHDHANENDSSGSGGGGFATAGGPGGSAPGVVGGAAGAPAGGPALVPLRGGCPSGGSVTDAGLHRAAGAAGGGAIQLASRVGITVTGVIDANGSDGFLETVGSQNGEAIYGGGAGGGILLEAPKVTLGPEAKLLAKGGGGATDGSFPTPVDDANPRGGGVCNVSIVVCGNGGAGGAPNVAAKPGGDGMHVDLFNHVVGGGGGGGLGRIRINTSDMTYAKAATTVEAGQLTTGLLGTK